MVIESFTIDPSLVTGQNVSIVGQIDVNVMYKNKVFKLPFVILDSLNKFTPLLGRNWLNVINPTWKNNVLVESKSPQSSQPPSQVMSNKSNLVSNKSQFGSNVSNKGQDQIKSKKSQENLILKIESKSLDLISEIKSQFACNFQNNSNSCIKQFKADITVKDDVKPIFHRAYEMPYSLKPKVEEELSRMVENGILNKVSHSQWASPIVIVPKKNTDDIRICVDFKKTVNKVIETDHCVLPLPDDIFASLSGSKCFTVLDLKGAFQQLEINEASKELFTVNTHLGLFRYNRLTYGISSAPGIFQSVMETILSGLPNVKCYIDDILIFGS